ncbi:chemotaxis-specific protein-glutamate methyltransferase CheB [Clostridium sp. CS001]|uniref:chemotaxis-specific protein-glutamate methyltransferase CheB n=1 Tax=Clostridium sp. CS001 TaxID=2880648 RepID=UPI001CF5FBCB|nr:chemotaxis-specific protein-glutamate methyltransferase CheB [Clostridium sp. CS001]MCB2291643.1 chemotaxis-specific protein-glutamate methyltransferase CheB [Clostridium sp. CS001]
MLKILIVDDSSVFRKVLKEIVSSTGIPQVIYTAGDGIEALDILKYSDVDIALLDIIMPKLGGIATLKIIKDKYPSVKVIIVSGISEDNIKLTMEALSNGAIDFIKKPTSDGVGIQKIKSDLKLIFNQILISKNTKNILSTLENKDSYNKNKLSEATLNIRKHRQSNYKEPDIILIAASTGGPAALDKIFRNIEGNINIPILVVQHMPAEFTKSLAESLNNICKLKVNEAYNGNVIERGEVLIAPGGIDMSVTSINGSKVIIAESSTDLKGARPSADFLFKSVANEYKGKKVLVVVLTGMGADGTEGVKVLKELCDCYCITESETSCVVYGMPRCIDEAKLSNESIHIRDIGEMINTLTIL